MMRHCFHGSSAQFGWCVECKAVRGSVRIGWSAYWRQAHGSRSGCGSSTGWFFEVCLKPLMYRSLPMPFSLGCWRILDWAILRIYFLTHLSNISDSAENGLYNAVIVDAAPTGYISDCMMNFVLKVNAVVSTKSTLQSFEMKMFKNIFTLKDFYSNSVNQSLFCVQSWRCTPLFWLRWYYGFLMRQYAWK